MVDIVVLDAVNVDVGAFGAFVTAAQAGQFDFGFQSVFIQKTLDNLKVFVVAAGKAGTSHTDLYRRGDKDPKKVKVYYKKLRADFDKAIDGVFEDLAALNG